MLCLQSLLAHTTSEAEIGSVSLLCRESPLFEVVLRFALFPFLPLRINFTNDFVVPITMNRITTLPSQPATAALEQALLDETNQLRKRKRFEQDSTSRGCYGAPDSTPQKRLANTLDVSELFKEIDSISPAAIDFPAIEWRFSDDETLPTDFETLSLRSNDRVPKRAASSSNLSPRMERDERRKRMIRSPSVLSHLSAFPSTGKLSLAAAAGKNTSDSTPFVRCFRIF